MRKYKKHNRLTNKHKPKKYKPKKKRKHKPKLKGRAIFSQTLKKIGSLWFGSAGER